jgi:hypothetical protein
MIWEPPGNTRLYNCFGGSKRLLKFLGIFRRIRETLRPYESPGCSRCGRSTFEHLEGSVRLKKPQGYSRKLHNSHEFSRCSSSSARFKEAV